MKLLFIADPVGALKPKSDSSFALARVALGRGYEVFWCTSLDVAYSGDRVTARMRKVLDCQADQAPKLGEGKRHAISDVSAVLIRKDPPFDAEYVRLCWLLALAESQVSIFNRPSLLLRYHEKLVPLEARAQGFLEGGDVISTHIGDTEGVRHFEKVVTKPFLGFGGGGVDLVPGSSVPDDHTEIAQPFEDRITTDGDRRVWLVGGEVLAHFVRMPKAGGFISNLAQGGSAESRELSSREKAVLERLGKFLKHVGIDLAGADVIGGKISEVNITSPTGLVNLRQLEGRDYSEPIIDYLARSVRERKR